MPLSATAALLITTSRPAERSADNRETIDSLPRTQSLRTSRNDNFLVSENGCDVATAWRGKGVGINAPFANTELRKKSRNGVNAPGNSTALGIDQRSKPNRCVVDSAGVELDPSIHQPPARIGGHYRQLAERSVAYPERVGGLFSV